MHNRITVSILLTVAIIFFNFQFIFGQAGTYYDALNISSPSFVTDLESRIRSPYTQISYNQFDETNIANFAAKDNGNGTKSVFCVYSNFEYLYTGTFTWLPMSREHTYCFSWQPGGSESLPEYSDQYHLFPTNQDNSNAVRSNHPLGIVSTVISTYLDGKYGKDINGNFVYEPRNEHKGDAARALLYMPLRYNGISGYDWTFNWLNNIKLPSLSEGPQDLATLIQWHKQDPPDKWEVDRNNYIQSVQKNRNPLVDHPEYVNYINFNDLTKFSPVYAVEPTNYVTNFSASTLTSSITYSWTDALAGAQAPSNYLLIAYNRNNYFLPIDGESYANDTDLSDGKAVINISYSGADSYSLTGLSNNTTYYGTIFSYNGSGTSTNYKINGTFPVASVLFGGALADEPTNHVTNFASGTINTSSIQVTWTDALAGTQAPSGYLLLANRTGSFSDPADGTIYTDDTNLADGSASVNILYSAADNYSFTSLTAGTTYYFKIFPYNGNAGQINYRTVATVPTLNAQTTSVGGGGGFADLVISEYVEGSSNNKAIEIYNGTSAAIDLAAGNYNLKFYFNGAVSATTINLTGTIAAGNVFVLAPTSANSTVLAVANQTSTTSFYNGDDAVILCKGLVVLDAIGQVGFDPGTEWGIGLTSTADNTLRRNASVTVGDTNPNDIFDPSAEWTGYAVDTFDGLGNASPLPVELTSFIANVIGNKILLKWETATETNNYGFDIERNTPLNPLSRGEVKDWGEWEKIGFVNGNGNSNTPKSYSFIDDKVTTGKYLYRLKQIDSDGKFDYSNTIEGDLGMPKKFELSQNFPNPFNPSTKIQYNLPASGTVKLTIYNILGEEIKTLVNEFKEAGVYTVNFDAANLNSGMYIYKIDANGLTQTRKMTFIK